jgi:hypothetical protein
MATTVKVSEDTDQRLTTLAARLYLKTRRKIAKQDLVALLVDHGAADEDALAARLAGIRYPVPDRVWKQFLRRVKDWGVETREEDIDRVLYRGDR